MGDAIEVISASFAVLIIFVALSSPIIIIALVYYLKKRLEHKQIMAAIEKGTPLAELRLPRPAGTLWIKNLTTGIALLIIAAALVCMWLVRGGYNYRASLGYFFVAVVLFAVGVSYLVRGLLLRKAGKTQNNTSPHNTSS